MDIENNPNSIFANIKIHVTIMHINFVVDLFSTILALFIILKYSPTTMGSYKYFLANITARFYKSFSLW
jgi:hypothetical protein